MNGFSCKTEIFIGCGAEAVIQKQNFQRLLVVSDPFFSQNGWAERLGRQAAAWEIFDRIVPDPSVSLVAEGVMLLQKFRPDGILALGGGSALDCAKAMLYFGGLDVPLLAIPTTSGSGSEVTDFAILTHEGVKHPLVDKKLRPTMAILEEALLLEMPRSLIADGGFDVLSHSLEGWVGSHANPFTNTLAANAFDSALRYLLPSFQGDKTARLPMHTASTMAGLAFTHAGLGMCHALAHSLGGQFHVPHGRLNAILLPTVVQYNATAVSHRYAQLARQIGLGGASDTIALRNLKNALIRLRRQLLLPSTLAEAGIAPSALHSKLDSIVAAAMQDACCQTNPIPVTEDLLRQVLLEVAGHG